MLFRSLEVFGLNIAEAIVLGKTVVATRCGGAEQQIQDGVNGFLVEPNKVQPLMSKMQILIDRKIDIEKMIQVSMASVIPLSEHVSKIINLYNQLAYNTCDNG